MDRRVLLAGMAGAGLTAACAQPLRRAPATASLSSLAAVEARHGGRVGIEAAQGGRTVAWRGDERFTYCSTFKLFLAAAVLERAQRGEERLDALVPITRADMVAHAPTTEPALGRSLSVEQLCQGTVELSDNPAANILIRRMGGLEAWRDWWPAIGDRVTRVDRLEPELNRPDPVLDTTTPAQTVRNLRTVLLGDRLDARSRALLEGWLIASPTGPDRIKGGAPAGARVAHKTGTWSTQEGGQTNDIGLIRMGGREPVLIAAYYTAPASTTQAQREAVIAEATRAALSALSG